MKRQEYRQRKGIFFNVEQNAWEAFQELCDKERKTISLKLNEMLKEELQKNEIGRSNPLNLSYGIHTNKSTNGITISMDRFIDVKEAKESVKEIPNEILCKFFNYNIKKINQQIQYKITGRITT